MKTIVLFSLLRPPYQGIKGHQHVYKHLEVKLIKKRISTSDMDAGNIES